MPVTAASDELATAEGWFEQHPTFRVAADAIASSDRSPAAAGALLDRYNAACLADPPRTPEALEVGLSLSTRGNRRSLRLPPVRLSCVDHSQGLIRIWAIMPIEECSGKWQWKTYVPT